MDSPAMVLLERGERRRLLGDRVPRRHVLARPLGRTTIIGTAFLSA